MTRVADAVADLHHVFATCPRPRHIIKPVLTARGAAAELREICSRDLRAGILFGPERAGLDNDDMAQADALVRFPLNPAFMSLNLAQAVMVVAYEWWTAAEDDPTARADDQRDACRDQGRNWRISSTHLVDQLDACGFLRNLPKRPGHGAQHPALLSAWRSDGTGVAHAARHRDGTGDRPASEGKARGGRSTTSPACGRGRGARAPRVRYCGSHRTSVC